MTSAATSPSVTSGSGAPGAARAGVIETRGLTKRYGSFVAVDGLDLTVHEGEVFGLLGPNGSGKTTTILMLLGLTEPSRGSVRVLGLDPARQPLAVKRQVGYLAEAVGFYNDLSGRENLRYSARLMGLPAAEAETRITALLERMDLAKAGERRVGAYSSGMQQRLGLAEVLLKSPRVAILDEPTARLDPQAAREFLGLIRELEDDGITVLLSSHLLPQVQAVCDRVGLFNRGKLVLTGTVRELAQQVLGSGYPIMVEARAEDEAGLLTALEQLPEVVSVRRETPASVPGRGELASARYEVQATADVRPAVAAAVVGAGAQLLSLRLAEPSLDEVYARYFETQAEQEVPDAAA